MTGISRGPLGDDCPLVAIAFPSYPVASMALMKFEPLPLEFVNQPPTP
jgi:hypothetical protein